MNDTELKVEWVIPRSDFHKIEDWNVEFSASVANLGIVHDAASCVMDDHDPYYNAIFGAYIHLKKLSESMDALIESTKIRQGVIVG